MSVLGVMWVCWVAIKAQELLAVVEITRHGARGPGKIYEFNREFWKETDVNELTGVGMRQHYLLGAELRHRYIDSTPLLPPSYNSSLVSILSTDSNRTISSAYCHLLGLYPPSTGPTLPPHSIPTSIPPISIFNLTDIQRLLGSSALPLAWEVAPVIVLPDSGNYVLKGYSGSVCPLLDKYEQETMNSNAYLAYQNELKSNFFPQLSQQLGISVKSIKEAQKISSVIECDFANGQKLPNITFEMFTELKKIHAFYRFFVPFSDKNALKLSYSAFLMELISILRQGSEGKGPKLTFFSSHDTMLAGLLTIFGVKLTVVPPFASLFLFEIYQNRTVKVIFNDKLLDLKGKCEGNPCDLEDLVDYLQEFIDLDYEKRCWSEGN